MNNDNDTFVKHLHNNAITKAFNIPKVGK